MDTLGTQHQPHNPAPESPFRLALDTVGNVVVGSVWLGLLIVVVYLAGEVLLGLQGNV